MASYITYKTIISKAITDFNAIQDALATIGATYNTAGVAATGSTGAVLVPTGDIAGTMTTQLQLKAAGTLTSPTVASDGTIDLKQSDYKSYRYVKVPLGSATTPATSITPEDLTGSFANGKFTVNLDKKEVSVTPTVNKGYITAGTAGTITVDPKSYEIPQLTAFKWSGASLLSNGNGYVVKDQILETMDNATITAGTAKTITVTNNLNLVKTDNTSVGGVNIYSKLLSLTEGTDGSYTNVGTTEPTSGNFIAFTAESTGGETSTTTSVEKAGYAALKSYTTEVSTIGHNAVTYYYPVKSAAATISGSKAATIPTADDNSDVVSGKTRIANATFTQDTTKIDKYFLALKATAPATTGIGLTPTVGTTGYLGSASQITGSASTSPSSSGKYYYAIPKATFGVTGSQITVSTPGYIGAGDTVANIGAGKLSYSAAFKATYTDVDKNNEWGDIDPATLFVDSLTEGQKAKDYYTITATGHGSLTTGYIGSNSTAATKTVYMPKATLAYITDSDKNKIVEVKTAGFLPAGILHDIGEISGKLDMASLSVSLPDTPTYDAINNVFKLTGSLVVESAGYVDSEVSESETISLAKTTYNGGGLSGAGTSTLSVSSGASYTSTTGTKVVKVQANNKTITRAAVTVATSGYDSAGNSVLGSSSATITGGSIDVKIKDGIIGGNSSGCSIAENKTTAAQNKGNAKVYKAAADADANNYVKVNATSSSSCSVTTAGWIDTVTKTGTDSDVAYLKASVNPTVTYSSTANTSNLAATTFTDNSTAKEVAINASDKKVTSTASATIPENVGDVYIVGELQGSLGTQGTAQINADCSGSNVDGAFQSLYNRMLGYQYNDVSPDAA